MKPTGSAGESHARPVPAHKETRQRAEGTLSGRRPGRRSRHPLEAKNEALARENERLRRRLEQAETLIDVEGKVSKLLGIEVGTTERDERP